MGMIRRGRKRLGATRDSLRSQAGVGKETLGGCRECHGETPRHERLFEVTEVGADVRFVERDGLHRRRRFMSDVGGRAGAARTFSEVRAWPFADLILQPKFRFAPEAAVPTGRDPKSFRYDARHVLRHQWVYRSSKPWQIRRISIPLMLLRTTWKRFQIVGAGRFEHDLLELGTGQNHDHKNQLAGFVH